ncbi:MAG: YceI family protein [Bacteroidetes bacterium]|nr:MAG: YceI family protein [Bacteroidota bacterium]
MKTILISICLITFIIISSQANNKQINTGESHVSFRIGNMRINNVSGTFSGMRGTVHFDPQNLAGSSFSVCVDASSVDTGNNRRDKHLREEEYFDVERFPTICYASDIISRTDDGFVTRGKLTIKGVTRIVTISFVKEGNTLRGTFSLNRLDYNVGEGVSTFLVSNLVEVTISSVLIP